MQHRAFVLLFAVSLTFAMCRALGLSWGFLDRVAKARTCGKQGLVWARQAFERGQHLFLMLVVEDDHFLLNDIKSKYRDLRLLTLDILPSASALVPGTRH